MQLEEKIELIANTYNSTCLIGAECTPYETSVKTHWRTALDNSQEGTCQRIFSKRKDKTAFDLGEEVRFCSRDNLTDKDKNGRIIECRKILCKSGTKSVLVRNNNEKIVKRT